MIERTDETNSAGAGENEDNRNAFTRDCEIRAGDIDEVKREVKISFSSELPVRRWFGDEVLSHDKGAVRLDRLNGGAALLVNHNRDEHVGVVTSASIDADRKGRAIVRFGKGAFAEGIFGDVLDGVRKHISVSYRVHKWEIEDEAGKPETHRAIDWEPMEISIVSVPADATVGVGRGDGHETSNETKERSEMKNEAELKKEREDAEAATRSESEMASRIKTAREEGAATARAEFDVGGAEEAAATAERKRAVDIRTIGATFADQGGPELAEKHVADGSTVDDFNRALVESIGKKAPPAADIGLTDTEAQRFSFVRAFNALANPDSRAAQENAAFERECSEAAAKRTGKESEGILAPIDVLRMPLVPRDGKRDLQASVPATGGDLIQTDVLGMSFIELLRNSMILPRLGITMLTDLVGNIAIPRHTTAGTAFWVAENVAPTESTQAMDQVTLTPKSVGAFTDYSKRLLVQSSIDIEGFVRRDLATVLGLEIDRVGLNGSGSGAEPEGVKNTTGIGSVTFVDVTTPQIPTFGEIVDLESAVATPNALLGNLRYLVDAAGRGILKQAEKVSAQPVYIWEQGNTVNGYQAETSNQVELDDYWFGNWADLILAMWGGLDLTIDPLTQATQRLVRVVVFNEVDFAVRHPESFALGS